MIVKIRSLGHLEVRNEEDKEFVVLVLVFVVGVSKLSGYSAYTFYDVKFFPNYNVMNNETYL